MTAADAGKAAHDAACALIDERRFREAVEPAAEACRLRPQSGAAWWNYAVVLKQLHRWAECLAACDRTIALDRGDVSGMHWNAGIAATALGDWARARAAWKATGAPVPPGDGPLEMNLGIACVRVSPDANPEVVYGKRLDPCRARILSVPLPDSERRHGDIVLHDGEPRGKRRHGGREVTVFDELIVLHVSSYGTWRVTATCTDATERDAILARFEGIDGAIEDWTESIQILCKQCSLGEPHDHHEPRDQSWQRERTIGLALRDEAELGRLRGPGGRWRRGIRDVTRVL